MPTFNTSRFTAMTGSAGASPSAAYQLSKFTQGKERTAIIPYTLVGTEAANDIINIIRLKEGAVVIPNRCRVVCEDPGTALTLHVGYASSATGLCQSLALTTAHDLAFTSGTAVANQYNPQPLVYADRDIFATVTVATALTAGAKLLFVIAYMDE